jgi:alcohol dehydrogenase (NADP+)
MNALQESLDRLQLDYLDMYLIHWPVPLWKGSNFSTGLKFHTLTERPLETTWKSMEACVQAGKTKGIGVSNFSIDKLKLILNSGTIPPAINQVERHPYLQQHELVKFCKEHNIHVTCYSPLASTNHKPSEDLPPLLEHPTIAGIAEKRDATPAQVVLRWVIYQGVSVIPKSVHKERIAENLATVQLSLTDDDMRDIAKLDAHVRIVSGNVFAKSDASDSPFTLATLWDE